MVLEVWPPVRGDGDPISYYSLVVELDHYIDIFLKNR